MRKILKIGRERWWAVWRKSVCCATISLFGVIIHPAMASPVCDVTFVGLFPLDTNTVYFGYIRETGSVSVVSSCAWTAHVDVGWIELINSSGTGNGQLTFVIDWSESEVREASITVGDESLKVFQFLTEKIYGLARPVDFDWDRKSDFAVYYPTEGQWYRSMSLNGFRSDQFGFAGTVPVVGDWDGDEREDIGCYHPPSGYWYRMMTSRGFDATQFGFDGTIPVVGDWDGDLYDDIGCYHPPSGMWYLMTSKKGFKAIQFGYGGTIPVVGDFLGNYSGGADEIGCYDPMSGTWFFNILIPNTQSNSCPPGLEYLCTPAEVVFKAVQFGFPGTIPVVGDWDVGCYDPSSGLWFRMSEGKIKIDLLGFPGTVPVVGDWDGDYRFDIASYHPPTGNWFLQMTTQGFLKKQFGFTGTIPLGR
jgi:hypothetical protein